MEVHHIKSLNTIGEEVVIDTEQDLVPICANCHRRGDRRKEEVLTVRTLKLLVRR